jgi:hypothetical protein
VPGRLRPRLLVDPGVSIWTGVCSVGSWPMRCSGRNRHGQVRRDATEWTAILKRREGQRDLLAEVIERGPRAVLFGEEGRSAQQPLRSILLGLRGATNLPGTRPGILPLRAIGLVADPSRMSSAHRSARMASHIPLSLASSSSRTCTGRCFG